MQLTHFIYEQFYHRHNLKSKIFGHTHIKEKNLKIND
jgi:hypothetical protein